jgi:hypothetical protein
MCNGVVYRVLGVGGVVGENPLFSTNPHAKSVDVNRLHTILPADLPKKVADFNGGVKKNGGKKL